VNKQVATNKKIHYPISLAARGAYLQAEAVLLRDLDDSSTSSGAGGADPGDGSGGDGFGGDGSGGDGGGLDPGGMGGEGDPGEEGGSLPTDSIVDEWARPGAVSVVFANDLNVQVVIRDEDAKLNILSIVSKDEEFAETSRERLTRLIDTFRDNTRGDISGGTADRLVDSMVSWLEGNRDTDRFPKPSIKTGRLDVSPDMLEEDIVHYPLTIDELVMCDGMTPEILFGYIDDGEIIPGLCEFITCYSNLVFDSIPKDEEEEEDPFSGEGDDQGEDPPEEGEPEEEDTSEQATETNNGRVNINTAPLPVLRALIDEDDIPDSVLERIVEFRNYALEARERAEERSDTWKYDSGDEGGVSGLSDYDEDEDFIFDDPAEVIERVEKYFETSFNLDEEAQTEFLSLLAVTSNVFTVYVSVKIPEGTDCQNFRAVIWRRGGATGSENLGGGLGGGEGETDPAVSSGGSHAVPLVPLEPWLYPLHLTDEEKEMMQQGF